MNKLIASLNKQLDKLSPTEVLTYFFKEYKGRVALASSMGLEDQVLTHILVNIGFGNYIFTLDTGRLFPQVYELIAKTNNKYRIQIKVYFPDNQAIEDMVNQFGINLFYESMEHRKRCCEVRKIEPLKRAFRGLKVWICGLRKEQSANRQEAQLVEWDSSNGLIKVNPLIHWSYQDVWAYIENHKVPYNPLHNKGYVSVGCAPCTRAIAEGEDFRAGRWWWEEASQKECGLHKRDTKQHSK